MNKATMPSPTAKLTLGITVDNYPEGFVLPVEAVIREGYRARKEQIQAGESFEFTFPQYGVLTFHGRDYTFVPEKGYARAKGYPDEMKGRW